MAKSAEAEHRSNTSRTTRSNSNKSLVSDVTCLSTEFSSGAFLRSSNNDATTTVSNNSRVPPSLGGSFVGLEDSKHSTTKDASCNLPDKVRVRESGMSMKGQLRDSLKNMAQDLLLKLPSLGIYGRQEQLGLLEQAFKTLLHGRGGKSSFKSSLTASSTSKGSTMGNLKDSADHDDTTCATEKSGSTAEKSVRFSPDAKGDDLDHHLGKQKQVVWVTGIGGSGKSSLVAAFKDKVHNMAGSSNSAFFASGKFEFHQNLKPYSGISQAMTQFCNSLMLYSSDSTLQDLAARLQDQLTQYQLQVLTQYLIPNMQRVLSLQEAPANSIIEEESHHQEERLVGADGPSLEALHTLQIAFQIFLRAVCSIQPLVLVLDDLQSADVNSLELIEQILSDKKNPNLLLIGLYRNDQLNESDKLVKDIVSKCPPSQDSNNNNDDHANSMYSVRTTTIALNEDSDLGVTEVNQLLQDFLNASDFAEEQVLALATLVHQKTQGRPFYVHQFISNLVMQESFQYNVTTLSWTWDLEDIQSNMEATKNVVHIMQTRLNRLSNDKKALLKRLACLESHFSYDMCRLVGAPLADPESIDESLTDYVSLGLINEMVSEQRMADSFRMEEEDGAASDVAIETSQGGFNGITFFWVHDKIQQSVMELFITKEELNREKLDMAENLLEKLNPEQMSSELFVVANLLNDGLESLSVDFLTNTRRLDFAKFNMRAGKKALEASAFTSAANFLNVGIRLLPSGSFDTDYELALDLYSSAAEAECYRGRYDNMQRSIDEIVERKSISLLDKRRAYNARLDSLQAKDLIIEAREECVAVLAKLGCRFPKIALTPRIIAGLVKTKMAAKKLCEKDVNEYALLSDPRILWIMALLDKLMTFAFLTESPLVPLIAIKAIKYTQKYGVGIQSAPMFALAAFLVCGPMGDYKTGKALADLSLKVLGRAESQRAKARTYMFVYGFVYHWSEAAQPCRSKLLEGYKAGLAVGDLENSCWNLSHFLHMAFFSGVSLPSLHLDVVAYGDQVEGFSQATARDLLRGLQHAVEVLMGTASSRVRNIVGEEKSMVSVITDLKWEMYTSFFLGDYARVAQIMNENKTIMDGFPGTYGHGTQCCYIGMSFMLLARTEKRASAKYKREAKKFAKVVKTTVDKGCPNATHLESLLDAFLEASKGKEPKACKNFEVAALLAGRKGFLQDQALAQQHLGEYYLTLGKRDEAGYHIGEAVKLFEIWGAQAVADMLKEKYVQLLAPVPSVCVE
ncbi:Transcriptional regulator [Seminavis robusta]|uniref:Transcriptional regulator n=1 Tax=Seminavis robusta TaxID=568900 RepID=A0A9N8DAV8_9STRA|nr:Transcriptional regulator [Seminavis robusta]|eukprot:Sro19_g013500.1 Transcriptional regulator (1249) ;mRNA; r:95179-99007